MKLIEKTDATQTLAAYIGRVGSEPLVVTDHGRPIAALVPIDNADMEAVSLSTNQKFLDLIEHSRIRARSEGAIPSKEIRSRFAD